MLGRHVVALAVGAAVLAASGCGGSSKQAATRSAAAPVSTTPPAATRQLASGRPLSRARWTAEGDAICARVNKKVSAVSVNSTSELLRILPQLAIYYGAESSDLGKLVPPSSLTGDWARIVGGLHLYSEYASRVVHYMQSKNENNAGLVFHAATGLHEQVLALAKQDGFKRCSLPR